MPHPALATVATLGVIGGLMEAGNLGVGGETIIDETDLQIQPKGNFGVKRMLTKINSQQRWTHLVPMNL